MAAIQTLQPGALLDSFISLFTAFVLGTIIGAERQYRQRTAGLRTTVLVAVGAAAFVDVAMRLTGADGGVRVIAYVVSGIGFLGAGVIMKEGAHIRGLNTAATLWGSAAVGAAAGADLVGEALLVAAFVLAGNTLLRPLANMIDRAPMLETSTEAFYELRVTVEPARLGALRDRLVEVLERADYPVSRVEMERATATEVELVATLVSTAVVASELDTAVRIMEHEAGVRHATWASRAIA